MQVELSLIGDKAVPTQFSLLRRRSCHTLIVPACPNRSPMPPRNESPGQEELPLFGESSAPVSAAGSSAATPATDSTDVAPHAVNREFLGWDASLPASAVTRLAEEDRNENAGLLDLSHLLVIVPTRNAGRLLRESLALRASERDAAAIPPLVTTPDYLVSPERLPPGGQPVAGRSLSALIWSALLGEIDLERFRRVFPVDPVERNHLWAMSTARELIQVRDQLSEAGLTMAAAAEKLAEAGMEPGRWRELAELDRLAVEKGENCGPGYRDPARARLEAAQRGRLPEDIEKIFVVGVSDLRPLAATALARYAGQGPVTVLVHAPEEQAEHFDPWGRPRPEHWLAAEIPIAHPERSLHAATDPAEQASLACELIAEHGEPDDIAAMAALGVPDAEVVAPLQQEAARRGWSTHHAAGAPLSRHGIHYLLEQTSELVSGSAYAPAARLFRCPDFATSCVHHLREQLAEEGEDESDLEKLSATRLVSRLDQLAEDALPHRLGGAIAAAKRHRHFRKRPEIAAALEWVRGWADRFREEDFETVLEDYLGTVFASRRFATGDAALSAFSEVAEVILETEEAFRRAEPAFREPLPAGAKFHLLLALIRERRIYDLHEPGDIDLQGWLELLWEDAPHLVITGMNDDFVPESLIGHAFLPDSARQVLGLSDNDDRFARDAYLLAASAATRRATGGRLDLVFGRFSGEGDPLRPSRLLFQCPDEELPGRARMLFHEAAEEEKRPAPREVAFPLRPSLLPPDHKVFEKLSPSSIKSYLVCPFRFYLSHGLGMKKVEPPGREMNAGAFGTLVHEVLDRYGRDPEIARSTEAGEIGRYFHETLDAVLAEQFGDFLSAPVVLQRESARKRLAWWAEIEAEERAAGWIVTGTEASFGFEDAPFELDGVAIRGRIDRIEEHPEKGLRVIDFKTHSPYQSNKFRSVEAYHLAPLSRNDDPENYPEWRIGTNHEGKDCRWNDLQLPLYLLAMREQLGSGQVIQTAHATLGQSQRDVVLDCWEGLEGELLESAHACARGVIASVKEQIFWPPTRDALRWDDYKELLGDDPEETVEGASLRGKPKS